MAWTARTIARDGSRALADPRGEFALDLGLGCRRATTAQVLSHERFAVLIQFQRDEQSLRRLGSSVHVSDSTSDTTAAHRQRGIARHRSVGGDDSLNTYSALPFAGW